MAKEKLPAIHLYPGDWLRDSISGCSLAAQGLWLRMIFVAHDAPIYGEIFASTLLDANRGIARRCGCDVDEFDRLFDELKAAGVPEIADGIVYSRRMVRDASLREIRAKAGKKGGKQSAKQKASKRQAKYQANIQQNTEDESDNEDAIETVIGFENFWTVVPRKVGRREAESAFEKAAARIAGRSGAGGDSPDAFLIERMAEFAKSAQGRSGRYCPHPATWLNRGQYDDDPAEWNRSGESRDPRGTLDAAREFLEMSDG